MDIGTLESDWREYEIVFDDGRRIKLRDCFCVCIGYFETEGGLGFDPGGEQGSELYLLKPDENGDLWQRIEPPGAGPEEGAWERLGHLERITDG